MYMYLQEEFELPAYLMTADVHAYICICMYMYMQEEFKLPAYLMTADDDLSDDTDDLICVPYTRSSSCQPI